LGYTLMTKRKAGGLFDAIKEQMRKRGDDWLQAMAQAFAQGQANTPAAACTR
jgi:hypothetical protein